MKPIIKQIILCTFGTLLEWYDFSLFAALAPLIAEIFFPQSNHYAGMMSAFVVFASGFMMRPIGAAFFGHLGDKMGRKSTLLITVFIMTISTTAIGLIPTGLTLSTLLLVFFRLAQGFAASGEYPSGITLLAEQLGIKKKGFVASFGIFAAPAGIFIGTLVCAIASKLINHASMIQWGWRIPFLIGAPLGLVGYLIRKSLLESEKFEIAKQKNLLIRIPLISLIKEHRKNFMSLMCLYIFSSVSFYINFIYLGSYSVNAHKLTETSTLYVNSFATLIYAITIPVFGLFSDYFGKKLIMTGACMLMISCIYPLFLFILNGSVGAQLFGQSLISIMIGMFVGPLAMLSADFFPTEVRCTGVGMSLNISTAIFGGTTPLVCVWLAAISNNPITPVYYLIGSAVIALAIIVFMKPSVSQRLI